MAKTDKDILTTADTAKILGVSVRTAQLLIEGGSIPSWKTPGGHRRVYRSDVMAIIEGGEGARQAQASAMVVVIGSQARLATYKRLFARTGEVTVELFEDVLAALVAVGSLKPHAIIIDADADGPDRMPLLRSLASNASIAGSALLLVGPQSDMPIELQSRVRTPETPENALAAIRASLGNGEGAAIPELEEGVPAALNEGQRLRALERSGLLDTDPEDAFDRLTWLATQMLGTPISLMTLLTASRQWFKSRVGLDMVETPRSWAFCNYTVLQREVFAVEDLASDPRFADNPAVAGGPGFRFYAGAPILDEDGFAVGSLCVIDRVPRKLDARGERVIRTLAEIASDELRLRTLGRRARSTARVAGSAAGRAAGSNEARAN